jgi:hypothetical protein
VGVGVSRLKIGMLLVDMTVAEPLVPAVMVELPVGSQAADTVEMWVTKMISTDVATLGNGQVELAGPRSEGMVVFEKGDGTLVDAAALLLLVARSPVELAESGVAISIVGIEAV